MARIYVIWFFKSLVETRGVDSGAGGDSGLEIGCSLQENVTCTMTGGTEFRWTSPRYKERQFP